MTNELDKMIKIKSVVGIKEIVTEFLAVMGDEIESKQEYEKSDI